MTTEIKDVNKKDAKKEVSGLCLYDQIRGIVGVNDLTSRINDVLIVHELDYSGFLGIAYNSYGKELLSSEKVDKVIEHIKDVWIESSYLTLEDVTNAFIDAVKKNKATFDELLELSIDPILDNIQEDDDGIYRLDVEGARKADNGDE